MLFNNTRLFDKNQQLSTASAIAFIFFKYMKNYTSFFLYLESGLPVHISWNTEGSRKQQKSETQSLVFYDGNLDHIIGHYYLSTVKLTSFLTHECESLLPH